MEYSKSKPTHVATAKLNTANTMTKTENTASRLNFKKGKATLRYDSLNS